MYDWFETLSTFEKIFWYIAVPFTLVFIIQLILSISGHDGRKNKKEENLSDEEISDGTFQASHYAKHLNFASCLFSLRNFILFLLTFGWAGILGNAKGLTSNTTLFWATACGLMAWLIFSILFYFWNKSKQLL